MALSDAQKGRIMEQLVAATLMLQSEGTLRVSVPLVDDEGVDLVVGNRLNDKTLLLQIKSRFVLTRKGRYRPNVRRATCKPDSNKFLLFVFYEKASANLGESCWLIRATDFCRLLSKQATRQPKYLFMSSFTSRNDMWMPYRLSVKDLAKELGRELKVITSS